MADPVEPTDDDADKWRHDDPTERTPRQKTAEERVKFDENQRLLYEKMKELADKINERLRNPWKDAA